MEKKRGEYITSTTERSLLKALSWEIIAFLITLSAVYLVYGDIKMSLMFTLILAIIKVIFLYFHERIWKKIMWGKILCKKKY